MRNILLIFLSVCVACAIAAGLTDAERNYRRALYLEERGDSDSALILLRQAADSAYPPAQNYLGYKYMTGADGIEVNADTALALIEKAAMSGDAGACNNLGFILSNGMAGVENDYAKARYWLEKGAAHGHAAASAGLARLLLEGKGGMRDTLRAESLLASAASRGLADAGRMLYSIISPRLDTLSGKELTDSALYYHHRKIWPVAAPLLQRASDGGDAYAMAIAAVCHSQGVAGFDYDYDAALSLFMQAAILGDPSARYIVAETLDVTPDAFSAIQVPECYENRFRGEMNTFRLPADDWRRLSADDWRQAAAFDGVTDSRTALQRLYP